MTEQEFEQRIEAAADRLERKIEASAEKLDRGITKKWNNNRLFRIGVKTTSIAAEIALIAGAWQLAEHGYKTAARWCLALAVLAITTDIITFIAFRKKSS